MSVSRLALMDVRRVKQFMVDVVHQIAPVERVGFTQALLVLPVARRQCIGIRANVQVARHQAKNYIHAPVVSLF